MASGNLGTLYYQVQANTGKLIEAERQVSQSTGTMAKDLGRVDTAAKSTTDSLTGLARAVKAVIAAGVVRELAGWVQQYQTMAERVQMATDSMDEFEYVQKRLQATANGTYRRMSEAQELYIRTADSLKSMGYSVESAIDVQDSLSYAFVTNATSADRASTAITQFSKAITRGVVSADQWETITSAIPSVIDDIAEASGRTAAEIRALGAAGKLTARDLTEGLRRSLEENKAAADGMATDLIDASVRIRSAITVTLVAMEEQTGAVQAVTDGIIAAAEALLAFGGDAEKMAAFLDAVTVAATATAAVIAGRLLTALGASTAALYQNTLGARAKATAELQAAQAAAALAAQNLVQAQTAERAARGLAHHATMAANLTAAQTAATTATARLTTAQSAMAGAFSVATMAANGLRTALTFLGGPAGLILLVAAAFLTLGRNATVAEADMQKLADAIETVGTKTLELRRIQLEKAIEEQSKKVQDAERVWRTAARQIDLTSKAQENKAKIDAVGAARVEALTEEETKYRDALAAVNRELARRESGADVGPQTPPGWTPPSQTGGTANEQSEFQKLEQSLKNQIELARRTGLARAELAALQRLGAEATDEEKQRITELVGELHRLEKATEAAEEAERERIKNSEEAQKAAEDNAATIAALREQLHQTTLEGEKLAQRQAELTLNDYATPEQIEQVRELAGQIYRARQEAAELERRKNAFGVDVAGAIRGDVSPLSGGMFDDQLARYQAEADAEEQRYAEQLERLREAEELKLEVKGGYMALEEQMAQEHADRMAQIEAAKNQVMLKAGEQGFGAMADMMEQAFGEQSGLYKAAFVAQKAFAIAQSLIAIQQGIAMAAANPWPLNLAAMASVAAATAGLVSNISSVSMGSGRQYGGPVSPNSMYRINETGAPEVFNATNGRQYMLPNTRGEVVSNRDATSGGGGVVINIHNAPPGTTAEQSTGQDGADVIDVWIADFMADGRTKSAVQGKFGLSPQGR